MIEILAFLAWRRRQLPKRPVHVRLARGVFWMAAAGHVLALAFVLHAVSDPDVALAAGRKLAPVARSLMGPRAGAVALALQGSEGATGCFDGACTPNPEATKDWGAFADAPRAPAKAPPAPTGARKPRRL